MVNEADSQNFSKENIQQMHSSEVIEQTLKIISSKTVSMLKTAPEDVCNPLMLQDITLHSAPTQLEKLFSHFEVHKLSKSEILFQLVYLVALESGFGEVNVYAEYKSVLHYSYVITSFFNWHNVNSLVEQKPKFWCDTNGTKFSMQLRNIVSDHILDDVGIEANTICTNMSAIVTGDLMIVSIMPIDSEDSAQTQTKHSICLTIPRYVIGTVNKKDKKLCECLRNMEEFVLRLRNEMFIPLRNYHFSLLELDAFPSLLGLPSEAYEAIFLHLNLNQLNSLANVNKLLNHIVVSSKRYEKSVNEIEKPFPLVLVKSTISSIFDSDLFY